VTDDDGVTDEATGTVVVEEPVEEVLAEWPFPYITDYIAYVSMAATAQADHVTALSFSSSSPPPSGIISPGPIYWAGEQGWDDADTYLTATVQADASYAIVPTTLTFDQATMAAPGPTSWTVRSSADGFTADLGSGSVSVYPTFTSESVDLSGLPAVTELELRWYGGGTASASTTTFGVDDVVLVGTVRPE